MTASTYLLDIIGCGKTKYLSKNTEHSEKTWAILMLLTTSKNSKIQSLKRTLVLLPSRALEERILFAKKVIQDHCVLFVVRDTII
jgi:hypothetical protein